MQIQKINILMPKYIKTNLGMGKNTKYNAINFKSDAFINNSTLDITQRGKQALQKAKELKLEAENLVQQVTTTAEELKTMVENSNEAGRRDKYQKTSVEIPSKQGNIKAYFLPLSDSPYLIEKSLEDGTVNQYLFGHDAKVQEYKGGYKQLEDNGSYRTSQYLLIENEVIIYDKNREMCPSTLKFDSSLSIINGRVASYVEAFDGRKDSSATTKKSLYIISDKAEEKTAASTSKTLIVDGDTKYCYRENIKEPASDTTC